MVKFVGKGVYGAIAIGKISVFKRKEASVKREKTENVEAEKLRLEKGLTLAELSKLIGVSDATLQRYESGEIQNIKRSVCAKLAEVFGCTEAYIMYGSGEDNIYAYDNVIPVHRKRLPVLGEIACGEPIYCDERYGEVFVTNSDTSADFCLIAKGDSMIEARIFDGDIVFIKSQSDVENGEIAAVIIDNEATLKRVYKTDNVLSLMPANPKYSPLVYTGEAMNSIRILGKAVGMQTSKFF